MKAIKIDSTKWKPIRCKRNYVLPSEMENTTKETFLLGHVIGFMVGEVLLLHPSNTIGRNVTGSPYINSWSSYPKRKIEVGIDGSLYPIEVAVISGKSITVDCRKCPNFRKLVGINEVGYAPISMLDSVHFL